VEVVDLEKFLTALVFNALLLSKLDQKAGGNYGFIGIS
jgi:hypothetical protein